MGLRFGTQAGEAFVAHEASYYKAPDALRAAVRSRIGHRVARRESPRFWRWAGVGAGFAMTAALSINGALLLAQADPQQRLADEVASAHVRSLLGESHLNDVVSTDQHTVKPWFQGKLDFGPVVTDLAEAGYALDGGRLDYLDGRTVAAITYRHRLHVVNLFEWPVASSRERRPELETRKGYAIARWSHGGLEYWAVSDAAGADILQLARLLQAN